MTIEPSLQQVLTQAVSNDRLRVIVRMKSPSSDLDKWPQDDGTRTTQQVRTTLVSTLQATAADSQRGVLGYLGSPDIAAQTDNLRTYWIFNGLALRATPDVINAIAARDDVASVRLDGWVQADDLTTRNTTALTETLRAILETPDAPRPELQPSDFPITFTQRPLLAASAAQAPAPGEATWGIRKIRADQVWRGLGVTGAGVVVANIDGGVDWQHPALQSSYRGWTGGPAVDHLHNWYDATDEGAVYPSDPNGHGTHTMGTMVGQNGVGVAPGARWMAAKGLNSQGFGLFSWIHSAFQFMLAPGGDPAYAPDIVNNSWSSTDGRNIEFREDVAALQRAGIFVVFANGNRGPQANTVGSPASMPGVIGVGATDQEDDVAYFSSRGPSPIDGGIKPVLSAPGVNVVSTFPGGGYVSFNGTSMAAPHVAGAAALLLSVAPTLSANSMLYVLTSTARTLSSTVPNNDSGWGRMDAYSAVLSILPSGAIIGSVRDGAPDAPVGQPIRDALVVARDEQSGRQSETRTDAQGNYALRVPQGVYVVEAGAFGYFTGSAPSRIVALGSAVTIDLALTYQPSGSVRGVVRDVNTGAYVTATVRALGTPKLSVSNNNCLPCRYALDLPTGTYVLETRAVGYLVQTRTVSLANAALTDEDFYLTPTQRIAFVDSGAYYYGSAATAYREALDALQLGYDEYRVKKVPGDTPTITQLLQYDSVIWSAPYDAPALVGASDVMSRYLAAGRNLLLTGQNVAFYDGGGAFAYHPYFSRVNALYAAKNYEASVVVGREGGPLAGKVMTFTQIQNQWAPDIVTVLRPDNGQLIGDYTNDVTAANGARGAGVWTAQCAKSRTAYYAFGLEAFSALDERADVISRTLAAFVAPRPALGLEMLSRDRYLTPAGIGQPGATITHVVRLRNTGDGGTAQTIALEMSGNGWDSKLSSASVSLEPCATANVTVTVSVPRTAGWDASDVITLTSSLQSAPQVRSVVTFTSKTPAAILLVDDERFSNAEGAFVRALAAQGNRADHWDMNWNSVITNSPPVTVLQQYPIVIWFNGYDWFDPIKPAEERALQRYLDGGGRLFFSSQAALSYTDLSPLVRNYFGVGAIDFNDVTSNVIGMPDTPLGDGAFGGSLLPFPYNWNLSSAVQPLKDTYVILRGESGQPFGLARSYAQTPTPGLQLPVWRTVFMPFAFEVLPETARDDLMNRIVAWLSPLGGSSLVADRASAQDNAIVNFTLVLRADEIIPPPAATFASAHPITMNVDLPAGMTLVSSSLPGATAQSAGQWAGDVRAGDVFTWTFAARVVGGLAAGIPLTTTARFSINDIGLRFSRSAIVRMGAPTLSASLQAQASSPAWGSVVSATLRVQNTSNIAAPQTIITAELPFSFAYSGPITATASIGKVNQKGAGTQLIWTGALPAGGAVTIQIDMRLPSLAAWPPRVFYLAAQADPGVGGVVAASTWIAPDTANSYYPFTTR